MSARRRQVAVGLARGRRLVADLARELDGARTSSGLTYAELGRAVGLSGDQVARICRGDSPNVSVIRLSTLLATVGMDLTARAFPSGPPIRDAAHVALLARLRAELSSGLAWRLEVPVVPTAPFGGGPVDRRAWDAVIEGDAWSIGVEAETRLGDLQALYRRIALKQRDGSVQFVLLLVNDTAHNRQILALDGTEIRSRFGGTTTRVLRCLRSGTSLQGNSLLVL